MSHSVLNNKRQRVFGVILQYSQMALSILIQLIYTPIMLRILGKNEYGIYNIAASTIAYLSLLSLGFGASYIRWYSMYKKNDDNTGISKLNGLYLIVFSFIGIIAIVVGFILTSNVGIFFNSTYKSAEIETAKILMFFLTINLAFSFPASVFISYISSQQKFVFQKIVNIGKTILSPVANIIFLYLGFGSVGMVISTTAISLIVDIVNIYFCFAKLKMKISFSNLNWRLLKDIFVFSIFIAINQIIDQINWQTDKIILGKIINGTAVAIYAVGAQINTMFVHFSTAVSSVFAPKVNMIVSRNEKNMDEQLTNIFIKVGRIQWFILSLILSGFIFFGEYFVRRWAGKSYSNSYIVALLLMTPGIIPFIQNIGIEIQRAKYKHKFRSIVYLFMALINVVLTIFLVKIWGEIGAALGTAISLVLANGIIMNIYYHKRCGINILKFWKSIFLTLKAYIIPVILGVLLFKFYSFSSLFDFLIIVLLYSVVFFVSLYFFGFNNEEKEAVNKAVRMVLKR
ncbi:MAG: oligosaccharide flippase family protein [Clostridia bacterium]|nr:oligosaccharide flippase family protein [Clostridia bacterium]